MNRPGEDLGTPTVEITQETETSCGWVHTARADVDGRVKTFTIRLAWVDHDHWSGGAKPPSETVRAVLEALLLVRDQVEIPDAFDAATARRWAPDLDALVRARL